MSDFGEARKAEDLRTGAHKACPFCGSHDIELHGQMNFDGRWAVCNGCGCTLAESNINDDAGAWKTWETRAEPSTQEWRDGIFKFLKEHWPAPNRVPYPAYQIADFIEANARALSTPVAQPDTAGRAPTLTAAPDTGAANARETRCVNCDLPLLKGKAICYECHRASFNAPLPDTSAAPQGAGNGGEELKASLDRAVLGMNTASAEWAKVVDENAKLRQQLEREQEAHAQLQARCFDGGSQSVFDAVRCAREENAALKASHAGLQDSTELLLDVLDDLAGECDAVAEYQAPIRMARERLAAAKSL